MKSHMNYAFFDFLNFLPVFTFEMSLINFVNSPFFEFEISSIPPLKKNNFYFKNFTFYNLLLQNHKNHHNNFLFLKFLIIF